MKKLVGCLGKCILFVLIMSVCFIIVAVCFSVRDGGFETDTVVPEEETIQEKDGPRIVSIGSFLFDVPREWETGADYSFYKDLYFDKLDIGSYSRFCYFLLPNNNQLKTSQNIAAAWAEELANRNSMAEFDCRIEEDKILDMNATKITYTGKLKAAMGKTSGIILLVDDTLDEGVLCLSWDKVGINDNSDEFYLEYVANTLRINDGTEEPDINLFIDLCPDTIDNYSFDMHTISIGSGSSPYVKDFHALYDTKHKVGIGYSTAHNSGSKSPQGIYKFSIVGSFDSKAICVRGFYKYSDIFPSGQSSYIENYESHRKNETITRSVLKDSGQKAVLHYLEPVMKNWDIYVH